MSGESERDVSAVTRQLMEETAHNDERKINEAFRVRRQLKGGAAALLKAALDQAGAGKAAAAAAFGRLDRKGAGLVSWKAFCHVMKALGASVTDAEMLRLMSVGAPAPPPSGGRPASRRTPLLGRVVAPNISHGKDGFTLLRKIAPRRGRPHPYRQSERLWTRKPCVPP